ncbi:MAG: hypothetical protein V4645_30045 [Pseudomonadota bacterium]
MANSLLKDTTIDTVVGSEEVPAIPYRPPVPARTVYESRNVCMFRYSGPGRYIYTQDPLTGQVTGTFVPEAILSGPGSGGGLQGTWSCQNEVVPVTYPGTPAQPYVPGYSRQTQALVTGYNLGWNAGARSLSFFRNNGYVEFKVRESVVGVICGINFDDGIDSGYNGNTVDFAYYCAHGRAWIIRNGVIGASVGTYTGATVFRIERVGTEIAFLKDDVEQLVVTTGVPTEDGRLEACLYSGGDEVFDPVLVQLSAPDLTPGTATLDGVLERMSMFAAAGAYAELRAELEPLAFHGESGMVLPTYAVGNFVLPPMSFFGDLLVGETATLAGVLEPLEMLAADHAYAELRAELEPLSAHLSAMEGNLLASMSELFVASDQMAPSSFLIVTMHAGAIVSAALLDNLHLSAEMLTSAAMGSALSITTIIEAAMRSGVLNADDLDALGAGGDGTEVWVVNLESNASTTYSNYSFNSFARIGNHYYGASDDGLFELAGRNDDGQPIQAAIGLGDLDFGSQHLKTISEAYVGMSGDGELYMKVMGEDELSYIYKTRGFGPRLAQRRIELGRGLQANYLTVELFNKDGSDFNLDSVEFRVADMKRKI